jgi:hypothetical protein
MNVRQLRRLQDAAAALGCTLVNDGSRFLLATEGGDLSLESWVAPTADGFTLGPGFFPEEAACLRKLLNGDHR